VGLERGPLSLVRTIEELLGGKSSGSGIDSREYDRRDPSRRPPAILYAQKLALTSPTSGGRSVAIVRSQSQDTVFVCLFVHTGWDSLDGGSARPKASTYTRDNIKTSCRHCDRLRYG
jgi:hypothetical protein